MAYKTVQEWERDCINAERELGRIRGLIPEGYSLWQKYDELCRDSCEPEWETWVKVFDSRVDGNGMKSTCVKISDIIAKELMALPFPQQKIFWHHAKQHNEFARENNRIKKYPNKEVYQVVKKLKDKNNG